jgi:chemosensory pili system protein ChpC
MAETMTHSVASLLIPIDGDPLILPNPAVAEIVGYRDPDPVEDCPEWLMGLFQWRGHRIPLIAFETVIGQQAPERDRRVRIAVLNTLNGNADLPFIGVALQGIPRLVRTTDDNTVDAPDTSAPKGILRHVLVDTQAAMIPDLDALETMLTELPA